MSAVFGPLPSRRLGRSLGIDPIPLKTCNWNCVYCQLGRTKRLCTQRQEWIPRAEIVRQVEAALDARGEDGIDFVTFVGGGEPTLHAGLGWMIRQVRQKARLPVAVITNGSLLAEAGVRDELCEAHVVLPSLDAGLPRLYRRINRPAPALRFDAHLDGLIQFREQFAGRLWLEVMLLKDVNDGAAALKAIATCLEAVRPDEVHLMLPLRPPAEAWVRAAPPASQERALEIFGPRARFPDAPVGPTSVRVGPDLPAALLAVLARHPMPEDELVECVEPASPGVVPEALKRLALEQRAYAVEHAGRRFWRAASDTRPLPQPGGGAPNSRAQLA